MMLVTVLLLLFSCVYAAPSPFARMSADEQNRRQVMGRPMSQLYRKSLQETSPVATFANLYSTGAHLLESNNYAMASEPIAEFAVLENEPKSRLASRIVLGERVATTDQGIKSLESLIGTQFELDPKKLPQIGESEKIPWPSDFFPSMFDSINKPSLGNKSQNAVSKYALAHNLDAKKLMDNVSALSGIDQRSVRGRTCQEDTDCAKFNDGSVCAKRNQSTTGNCVPNWFGLCHAWAPAAILEDEPGNCTVSVKGVDFEIMDIKALLIHMYHGTNFTNIFTARRCNEAEPKLDEFGRMINPDCRDMTPDFFHLALTNTIGVAKKAVIVDIASNIEVWNQPVMGYQIDKQETVTAEKALELITLGASNVSTTDSAKSMFPQNTDSFLAVTMQMKYISEATGNVPMVSTKIYERFVITKSYQYVLCLDNQGKIIGGEWTGASKLDHPDFLWLPKSSPPEDTVIAGGIRYSDIKQMIQTSNSC